MKRRVSQSNLRRKAELAYRKYRAIMVLTNNLSREERQTLGANHITFTMAVVVGAATSFLTPIGHKANVLVFGPGGYRFFDYARVGALLTVALLTVSMIFLPLFWPLFP